MQTKPNYCFQSGCPLAHKGTGFVLGSGDPKTAKLALLLEAPGSEEVLFRLAPEKGRRFYETQEQCDAELNIRRRDYPELSNGFTSKGVPVVGRSGFELVQWAFPAAGIRRDEIFIDNGLRCLPPKRGDSHYPLGDERKKAEACCRHFDRWGLFRPAVAVVSLHPAGIVREPTALWLQVKNLEKARDFVAQGLRTLVLAGGKAAKWWLGYGENVTRWEGHYEFNDVAAQERRRDRLERYGTAVPRERGSKCAKEDIEESGERTRGKRGRRTNAVEALLGGF
jgi:hypothetical protein